jgi:hypothetical protein
MVLSLVASGGGEVDGRAMGQAPPSAQVALTEDGPFRFKEQIWLGALKEGVAGGELALHAASIFKTSSGRYYVPAQSERLRILRLRGDGAAAAAVAQALAKRNSELLAGRLGHAPSAGELYLAHVFSAETAVRLLELAERAPGTSMREAFPELARLEPQVLGLEGRAGTVGPTVARLKRVVDSAPLAREMTLAGRTLRLVAAEDEEGSIARWAAPLQARLGSQTEPGWRTEVRAEPAQ